MANPMPSACSAACSSCPLSIRLVRVKGLRELDRHYGQGYRIAKPLDEQQLTALLHQQAADHWPAGNEPLNASPIR